MYITVMRNCRLFSTRYVHTDMRTRLYTCFENNIYKIFPRLFNVIHNVENSENTMRGTTPVVNTKKKKEKPTEDLSRLKNKWRNAITDFVYRCVVEPSDLCFFLCLRFIV